MRTGRPRVFDKQQIIAMYTAGKSYRDVAAAIGCSPRHVNRLTFAQRLTQQSRLQRDVALKKDVSWDISPSTEKHPSVDLSKFSREELEKFVIEKVVELASLQKQVRKLRDDADDVKAYEERDKKRVETIKELKARVAAAEASIPVKDTHSTDDEITDGTRTNKPRIVERLEKLHNVSNKLRTAAPQSKSVAYIADEITNVWLLVDGLEPNAPRDYSQL